MSGPKAADVALKLDRAVRAARSHMEEAIKNAFLFEQLSDDQMTAARRPADGALAEAKQPVSEDTAAVLPKEAEELRRLGNDIEARVDQGNALMDEAARIRQEAFALHEEGERMIADATNQANAVLQSIAGRAHYLTAEDRKAQGVRNLAQAALKKEKDAAKLFKQALDKKRAAEKAYGEAEYFAQERKALRGRCEGQAREKREAQRIAEQAKREATEHHNAARGLMERIEKLDHQKFAPGELDRIRPAADRLMAAFARDDHAAVNQEAQACVGALEALAAKVAEQQRAWENARRAAAKDLEDAEAEAGAIDRDDINRWSGDSGGAAAIDGPLEAAREALAGERFDEARQAAKGAVEAARRLDEAAKENKAKGKQREQIADAIMNALYEQGYDEPAFYLAESDATGNENDLSDLVIFAKAPGDKGDMRMQIDLEGHVGLEVEGIPEGEEHLCHQLIADFQEQLGGEIEFNMVDWGRAANAAGPARLSGAEPEKDREKQRERQGE